MIKIIFLDVDGVLNTNKAEANGYCQIFKEKIAHLDLILSEVPDVQIVLSSSWRYSFTTPTSVQTLLSIHGCHCDGRIHGVTELDEIAHGKSLPDFTDRDSWSELGRQFRSQQIMKYVRNVRDLSAWCAIDDLALDLEYLVQTDESVGMTGEDAIKVIEILSR